MITSILLRKTNAEKVAKYYDEILGKLGTPINTYNLKLSEIEELLKPLGLHRSRAKQLKKAAEIILKKYGGKMPTSFNELLKIPGVGKYAASAILSIAYGKNIPVVDINVERVISRFFGVQKPTYEEASKIIMEIAGEDEAPKLSLAIIDFAAKVCRARNPTCRSCPLNSKCKFNPQNQKF
ncbi:MAG: A/G-specific adenine glycosylase [archaeon GB-1867-005]|nr:A/G-specific adenine glycosylase [Candidatus Culexmicrobium cathedralense]